MAKNGEMVVLVCFFLFFERALWAIDSQCPIGGFAPYKILPKKGLRIVYRVLGSGYILDLASEIHRNSTNAENELRPLILFFQLFNLHSNEETAVCCCWRTPHLIDGAMRRHSPLERVESARKSAQTAAALPQQQYLKQQESWFSVIRRRCNRAVCLWWKMESSVNHRLP